MKIDAGLNFVIPLYHDEADADPYAYVYSCPISTAAFEASYRLLVRTFRLMMEERGAANRFARLFLRDAAAALAGPDGNPDVICAPLLNEIGRLSSVIIPGASGWQTIPLQQAIDGKLLDPGDGEEAISASIFFTAAWHISPKAMRLGLLESGLQTWNAQTSSLPPTEWIASLRTSTATASSGAMVPGATVSITVQGRPAS
jgi:hypothetical protein